MKYLNIINMLCISILLGACGGSSSTAAPAPAVDPFINQVNSMTTSADETVEAIDIKGMTATEPEDAEPAPLS